MAEYRTPAAAAPVVWALHDGKIGLRNQAVGVAEALGLPVVEKRLSIRLPWRILPPALWWAAIHAPGRDGDRLAPPWPVAAIAAGGRAAAPALAVRAAAGGRCLAVQIQNPHVARHRFDLMVVPEHDGLSGPNVMVSRGAVHRVTASALRAAIPIWAPRMAHLPHPRVAVLIGGGNGSYRMPIERVTEIAAALVGLAGSGAGLMITTSRRTGTESEAILREALAGHAVEIWNGTGENPYFGYLALADYVLATADSISMITEASITGRPIHILDLPGVSAKFQRFHQSMRQAGVIRPFAGKLEDWSYPIRNDTLIAAGRIGEMLRSRGLIGNSAG